jgi:uncharacterized Ntn-hydrolase superfamily protein
MPRRCSSQWRADDDGDLRADLAAADSADGELAPKKSIAVVMVEQCEHIAEFAHFDLAVDAVGNAELPVRWP